MAYTPNTYSTDGSVRDFNITFPFLRESDVRVTVFDSVGNELSNTADYDVAIQKPDATFQIRVVAYGTINNVDGGTALASGYTVTISRVTDISTLITVFQDGASLRAEDINALISQINYALEEFGQNTTTALGKNITQTAWDATNLRITNLAQPTADNDAIRKVDVDSGIGPDITTVAGIAANVTNVANDATDIGVLAADISGTNTIGTVSTNIAAVQNVSASIANVNLVSTDLADITTVAADIEVGGPDNIGTVAAGIGDVAIVAGINGPIQTVSTNIADVTAVATDLSGADNTGTVATNIASVNTVAGISSDVTSLAPQASNIGTLTQAANLTALQNAQTNAQAAQAALNQLNNKYHGSFTNVNNDDAEVEADIAGDANLTLEAGDLYFDTTNSKLRYYDGSNWYNAAAAQVINTTSLQNVGDVNAYSGLTTNDFLKYDGTGWQNVDPTAVKSALSIAAGDVSGLSTVATSNSYNDLANLPTLGTAAAAATTDFLQPDDVVNDVTTGGTQVPLSAQQGVDLKSSIDSNTTAIGTKQAAITTSSGTINAQSLTTYVTGDSGSVSVDVRKANPRTTTGTHTLLGGATLYYANAAATYDTASLTPGDIVTIYNEGGGAVTVNTGGTVSLFKDGEASAVTAAVTIGADTIATVTCVSATKAIIAGSDLT